MAKATLGQKLTRRQMAKHKETKKLGQAPAMVSQQKKNLGKLRFWPMEWPWNIFI